MSLPIEQRTPSEDLDLTVLLAADKERHMKKEEERKRKYEEKCKALEEEKAKKEVLELYVLLVPILSSRLHISSQK